MAGKYSREARGLTPEQIEQERAYGRAYRAKNREKVNAKGQAWRRRNPDCRRKEAAKRLYGLTLEQYDAILDGPCALCERPAATIDHCHDTGLVRGGLCRIHNVALGQFGDDPKRLEAAARYLREADALAELAAAA